MKFDGHALTFSLATNPMAIAESGAIPLPDPLI